MDSHKPDQRLIDYWRLGEHVPPGLVCVALSCPAVSPEDARGWRRGPRIGEVYCPQHAHVARAVQPWRRQPLLPAEGLFLALQTGLLLAEAASLVVHGTPLWGGWWCLLPALAVGVLYTASLLQRFFEVRR